MSQTRSARPFRAVDRAAIAAVRRVMSHAGFTESGLEELLGPRDPTLLPAEQEALWTWRARGSEACAVLARLFLLNRAVSTADGRALGPEGLAPWSRLGLVRLRGRLVEPRVQLFVHRGLVIASDADPLRGAPPAEHVLGPTTATLLLDRMIDRRPVRRALDLGTGTGFLALLLASQATSVVAADVAPRALRYAALNAALNETPNVHALCSDRFAGLGRRRFDLVVGNLPFVISPERRYVYRDAGAKSDDFFASVVRETGRRLEEGGFAQYLGQWVHLDGEPEDEHLAPWLAAAGCDASILRLEREPVDRYAARWLAGPARLARAERERRFGAWMRFFAEARIREISTGLWTLRRRATSRHFMVVDEISAAVPPTGVEVMARFDEIDRMR